MGVDYSCLDDDSDSGDMGESWMLSKALAQGGSLLGFVPRRIELICTGMDGVAHAKSTDDDDTLRSAPRRTAITAHELLARMTVIATDRATNEVVSKAVGVEAQQQQQQSITEQDRNESDQQTVRAKPDLAGLGPFDPNGFRQDLLTLKQLPTPVTAGITVDDGIDNVSECQSMDTSVSYAVHSDSGDGSTTGVAILTPRPVAEEDSIARGLHDRLGSDSGFDNVTETANAAMQTMEQAHAVAKEDSIERDSDFRIDREPDLKETIEAMAAKDTAPPGRSHANADSHGQIVAKVRSSDAPVDQAAGHKDDDEDSDSGSTSSDEPLAQWAETVASNAGSHQAWGGPNSGGKLVAAKTPVLAGAPALAEESASASADGPMSVDEDVLAEGTVPEQVSYSSDEEILAKSLVSATIPIPAGRMVTGESAPVEASVPVDGVVQAERAVPMEVSHSYDEEILVEGSVSAKASVSVSEDKAVLDEVSTADEAPMSDEDDVVMDGGSVSAEASDSVSVEKSMPYGEEIMTKEPVPDHTPPALPKTPEPTDDASSGKQKKRIAPMLLTSVVPAHSEGNLVEGERTGLSLVLPAQQMPASEAREVIRQA
ncbi:hypothetical protein LPJ53_005739, partial [Coemansia erecta]